MSSYRTEFERMVDKQMESLTGIDVLCYNIKSESEMYLLAERMGKINRLTDKLLCQMAHMATLNSEGRAS